METTILTQSFTCFPLLPKELRLKVWEHAQPFRILRIYVSHSRALSQTYCDEPLLPLVAVNHESRQYTLRFYVAIHGSTIGDFYFNCDRDTLFFADLITIIRLSGVINHLGSKFPNHKIRRLAILESSTSPKAPYALLLEFTHLEELVIVIDSSCFESVDMTPVKSLFPRKKPPTFPNG